MSTVTGASLAELLTKVVADPTIAKNVGDISQAIASEDGLLKTHELIERAMVSFRYPWAVASGADLV